MLYDIVVIGGGTSGYVSAIRAADGSKGLFDRKGQYWRTCLNRGCIPTKTLLKCSQVYNTVK